MEVNFMYEKIYEVVGLGRPFRYTDRYSGQQVGARIIHLHYDDPSVEGVAVDPLFVREDIPVTGVLKVGCFVRLSRSGRPSSNQQFLDGIIVVE